LFIVYFGLQMALNAMGGAVGLRVEMNAAVAGVIALSVVVAAYSSEVWVSALRSMAPGQAEAAMSLGMDRKRTFALVVLPWWCCRSWGGWRCRAWGTSGPYC